VKVERENAAEDTVDGIRSLWPFSKTVAVEITAGTIREQQLAFGQKVVEYIFTNMRDEDWNLRGGPVNLAELVDE
jgi:hypothetical protein